MFSIAGLSIFIFLPSPRCAVISPLQACHFDSSKAALLCHPCFTMVQKFPSCVPIPPSALSLHSRPCLFWNAFVLLRKITQQTKRSAELQRQSNWKTSPLPHGVLMLFTPLPSFCCISALPEDESSVSR